MSEQESKEQTTEEGKSGLVMGPDGVERTKNEHKKYLKKIEKE